MNKTENIFFLAGFPRSGTTWFANLLNSHPKVIYRHEIIGRNFHVFGDELFEALKCNNGLSDEEYANLIARIGYAQVDTDKPPFFKKSSGLLKYKNMHYYLWLATKGLPALSPVYKSMFSIRDFDNYFFLIKETRSTVNMDSMIAGLRPAAILYLVRHPCGVIASHLKGIETGLMGKNTEDRKDLWFRNHGKAPYVTDQGIVIDDLYAMSDAEYLGLQWRIYHDDLLRYYELFPRTYFYSYEDIVEDPLMGVRNLLAHLHLDFDDNVFKFITESTGTGKAKKHALQRDASNEYYSVYRKKSFNPQSWTELLSHEDIAYIDKHTASTYELISNMTRQPYSEAIRETNHQIETPETSQAV